VTPPTILVVDDSRSMRRVLMTLLRTLDYTDVIQTTNARDALTLITAGAIDVVFVDWNLPYMNGFAFVRDVRALPSGTAVAIIAVTSEPDQAPIIRALPFARVACVIRPLTAVGIKKRMDALIGGGQASSEK
jgi:two-component system, chemotaxis family, chemotaxis protein CheY